MPDQPSGFVFLLLAVAVAVAVAAAANWALSSLLGLDVKWWVSISTAAVVGLFVASAILGRRRGKKPVVEGPFDVE